jgi:hypothetical protein
MPPTKISGFLLLLGGLLLLIYKSKLVPVYTLFTWTFLFMIAGIILIFLGFLKSHSPLVLWGGFTLSISLFAWGKKYIDHWPTHWSILLTFIAITVLLAFALNKKPFMGLFGAVLLLIGIFAWPGVKNLPILAPIGQVLNTYWPILLIVLGFIFLIRK